MILFAILHFVFSTIICFVLSAITGRMSVPVSIISLICGTALAAFVSRFFQGNNYAKILKAGFVEKLVFGFIIVFVFLQSLFLFYSAQGSLRTQLANNLGDLPMHISYIKHMSSGAVFPPINPIFSNDLLRYPYGLHVYNAMWDTLGVGLGANLFVTTFVLLLLCAILLYWWKGQWALGAAFLNGGWAAFYVLSTGRFFDLQNSLVWKNFTVSLLLTQRGFLIAIPICIFLFKSIEDFLSGKKEIDFKGFVVLGILWGALPFFHTHSFFVFSIVMGVWMLIHFIAKSDRARVVSFAKWSLPTAIIVGTPIMLFLTDFFKRSSIIRWKAGWMIGDLGFWKFWYRDTGLWFILAGLVLFCSLFSVAWILIKKSKTLQSRNSVPMTELKIISLFVFFGIFHFVMMAVWEWDNIKVFFWLQLLLVVYGTDMTRRLGIFLASTNKKIHSFLYHPFFRNAIKIVLVICLFSTGVMSLVSAHRNTQIVDIYNEKEVTILSVLTDGIDRNKVFLAEPTYNNPLGYLGFSLVCGYDGHLYSHGIDYLPDMRLTENFYKGEGDYRQIAAKLKADYVLYGPKEKARFGDADLAWRRELTNLSTVEGYELYSLAQIKGK